MTWHVHMSRHCVYKVINEVHNEMVSTGFWVDEQLQLHFQRSKQPSDSGDF